MGNQKEQRDTSIVVKFLAFIILVGVSIFLWYLAIPAVVVWYLYKKDKNLSPKIKFTASIVTAVVFLSLGGMAMYINRAPTLTITEPQNNTSIQAASITVRGTVSPKTSTLRVNELPVSIDPQGNFSYEAKLANKNNSFNIQAENNGKKQTSTLAITRIFTPEEIAENNRLETEAAERRKADAANKIKQRLQVELYRFETPFDTSKYRDSLANLKIELSLFKDWAQLIEKGENYPDPSVQAVATELEHKISQLQTKEFPLMRKNYADSISTAMWENNVDVRVIGGGYKTIEFVGAMFANNKNKADAQAVVHDVLVQLRFTRANYKWYKDEDEYTYFKIDSRPDGEVVSD